MSESFIHSFNRFIQMADSFRTSQLTVLMNGPLNQLTHSIHSNTWIHSVTKHCCVVSETRNSSAVALIATTLPSIIIGTPG